MVDFSKNNWVYEVFTYLFGQSKEEQRANVVFVVIMVIACIFLAWLGPFKHWTSFDTLLIGFIAVYFIPSYIARNRKGRQGIICLNVFLGWTFIGWVAALSWALAAERNEKDAENKNPLINVIRYFVKIILWLIIALFIISMIFGLIYNGRERSAQSEYLSDQNTSNLTQSQVEVLSHSCVRTGNSILIVGEVLNKGKSQVQFVRIDATYYNNNDKVVGTDYGFATITDEPLYGGDSAPFKIYNYHDVKYDHYKLRVSWMNK
jgi:hypothetical protein